MFSILSYLLVGAIILALCITQDRESEKKVRFYINNFHSQEKALDDC